jgi:hypothetical protein
MSGTLSRDGAGGGADASVVEQDHFAVFGKAVNQGRIPVVEIASEVLQAKQGRRVGPLVAEAAVDECRALDSARRFSVASCPPLSCVVALSSVPIEFIA